MNELLIICLLLLALFGYIGYALWTDQPQDTTKALERVLLESRIQDLTTEIDDLVRKKLKRSHLVKERKDLRTALVKMG